MTIAKPLKRTKKQPVKKAAVPKAAQPAKKAAQTATALAATPATPVVKLPNVFRLTRESIGLILSARKVVFVVLAFYIILQLLLASGLTASLDISALKDLLKESFTDSTILTGVTLYGVLLTTLGKSPSDVASIYQSIFFVLFSLFFIYVLRQAHAGQKVSMADVFYKACAPLIQFLLVFGMIVIHLLPMIAATFIYGATIASGIAVTLLEKVLWGSLVAGLTVWSLYLLAASVMALYIVTLPDMRPLRALRSAKQLVRGRRWLVLRKLLFLPVFFLLAMAVIIVPTIILAASLTTVVFFLLVSLLLPLGHSYIFTLYRKLL